MKRDLINESAASNRSKDEASKNLDFLVDNRFAN